MYLNLAFVPFLHLIKSREIIVIKCLGTRIVFLLGRETCPQVPWGYNLFFLCFRIKALSVILMAFYPSNHFDANVGKFGRDDYSKYILLYLMSIFINSYGLLSDQLLQKQE